MPRSGTRNFVNALNVHPSVMLTGEISQPAMRKLLEVGQQLDRSYRGNDRYTRNWQKKRNRFLLESMFSMSKSPRREFSPECAYVGTKTPNHEFLYEEYERYYAELAIKPRYVFCARRAESCWASYRSMTWARRGVRAFLKRYVSSYNVLRKMLDEVPDRCVVANLDLYVASDSKEAFLRSTLFEPLGLTVDEGQLAEMIALKNTNSTLSRTGAEPEPVSEKELRIIRRHRGIRGIEEEFFATA
jgi:hypothetical protein